MYRCNNCDKEFEESKRCSISGEFWGAPFTEYYSGCPYCKSNDISEIRGRCDCCHCNLYDGDFCYELPDGSRFCEDCIEYKEV